jgi:hypothetical protein
MQRPPRLPPLIFGVVVWLFSVIAPLSAIGPSVLMFYGGDLAQPIFVRPGNPSITPTGYLWNPVNGGVSYGTMKGGAVPPNLEGRRYLSVAIFWGAFDDPTALKPADASQHGRIYLPTASEPAVVVVTPPNMANPNNPNANPEPVPIPASLSGFIAGWKLTPAQTTQLRLLASIF